MLAQNIQTCLAERLGVALNSGGGDLSSYILAGEAPAACGSNLYRQWVAQ